MTRTARPWRGVAALALGGLAVGMGVRAWDAVQTSAAVAETCDAAQARDWDRALSASQRVQGNGDDARTAAECACAAQVARQQPEACARRLAELLAHAPADWVMDPLLVHLTVKHLMEQGDSAKAAALARRAGAAHPHDEAVLVAELDARGATEDEPALLQELAQRVGASDPSRAPLRAQLAYRHLRRESAEAALAVLGAPPPGPDVEWFHARGRALGALGRTSDVAENYRQLVAAGGKPADALARHALVASTNGLDSAQHPLGVLLLEACEHLAEVADAEVASTVAYRAVMSLAAAGRTAQALALLENVQRVATLPPGTRSEVLRTSAATGAAGAPRAAGAGGAAAYGTLHFRPVPGTTLWVSAPPADPADAPHQPLPWGPDGAVLRRPEDVRPVRWVLRDAQNAVVASGSSWPGAPQPTVVTLQPGPPPIPPTVPAGPAKRSGPADGTRRAFVVILDCGDWRLVRHLQARGELPTLTALMEDGFSGVLRSSPAYTAAAMEALTQPGASVQRGAVQRLHHLGEELASHDAVGTNPLDGLRWLLPPRPDLMSTLGGGKLRVANLLFSHGSIRAGRHAVVTGPLGASRALELGTSQRPLTPAEQRAFPDLAGSTLPLALQMAAVMDAAVTLARDRTLDVVLLRVDALDTITHAHLADISGAGQDNGRGFLYEAYRMADARLAEVAAGLDEDDALLVMSDHGITTAMVHSEQAMWVAHGVRGWKGRAGTVADLGGVPWLLARLMGVRVSWGDQGMAAWGVP